jgi:multidrug efflux pump
LPQLRDVTSDLQDRGLQAALFIDRSTASRLGITPDVVDNTLYSAFGQRIVSTIFTQVNQNRVVLEVQPDFQRGPHALNGIYVTGSGTTTTDAAGNVTASGPRQVPLNTIATLTEQVTPLAVTHIGQFPAATISFNLAPGAALGDAVNDVNMTCRLVVAKCAELSEL